MSIFISFMINESVIILVCGETKDTNPLIF